MTETKYGKYVINEPLGTITKARPERTGDSFHVRGKELGIEYTMAYFCITKPFEMVNEAHAHDFLQVLAFIGGDPMNMKEFDAEVELYLGEEGEKQLITKSSYVYIEPGLVHGPLNFKTINKPIVFIDTMLASQYVRKPPST